MIESTITGLSKGLAAGEFSSMEITRFYLDRIKTYNPTLNAFITVLEEKALRQAQHADEVRRKGQAGPLTGIPIAHKDIFCTQGVLTTCASRMLADWVAPYDATVVYKYREAGMVTLGKTNMDEFAMGSSNETSYLGPVKNPWDTGAVPGGSSGGSAAAVAARLVPAATGTDTGGSIRQPAALCGITGLKPTYGRVSRYGMIAFASSLDQAGPMTQTAEDAGLLLQAMAGFDDKDSTCVNQPVDDYLAGINTPIKGLRIGLPKEYFDGLDPAMAKVIASAMDVYKSMGAQIIDIRLPNAELSVPTYYVLAPAECSSNLARFDGVRYGYRCENPTSLEDLYRRTRAQGFGAEVKRRIMVGTYVLSEGYKDAFYVKALKLRRLISQDFSQAFEKVDVVMGPATPTTAFPLGEKCNDPVTMYLSDIYTIAVNLAGLPGMCVPAGFIGDKPVGLQIIGPYFSESRILQTAHQFQQQTDWHRAIPQGVRQ